MSFARACPSCTQINPSEANFCIACGAELPVAPGATDIVIDLFRLEVDVDTVPAVHLDAPELQRWFDSSTHGIDTAHAPLDLTLRSLDDSPTASPALPPSVTKAARRAAVRRSRLSDHRPSEDKATVPADVLVLERDDGACEQLCSLLENFGFRAHPVQTPVQAVRMLDAKHFAAAFLDLTFDGPQQRASVDLCQRVKTEAPHTPGAMSALIIILGSTRPVERVRATLAGGDVFLVKPMTRGAVAQALEACGVALPADSRRC